MTNTACANPPAGFVLDNTDFNDMMATAHPNAKEICDNIDNNNDGNIDEILIDADDDGIADCSDNCPDTPNGERVGMDGCSCSQLTIDDGDFCTTDICRDGLVANQEMNFEEATTLIENTNPTNFLYTASQTITTDQNVVITSNKEVRFYAGSSIILKPGFTVEAGANFEAKITTECVNEENSLQEESEGLKSRNQQQEIDLPLANLQMDIAPNPFNNQTNIRINLPQASFISLEIYDLNGQVIERILEQTWQAKGVATITYLPQQQLSGMYYLVLKTSSSIQAKPIVMME